MSTMRLTRITMSGNKDAFLIHNQNEEMVGIIARYNTACKWTVYKGIGLDAAFLGTARTKPEAIAKLEKVA